MHTKCSCTFHQIFENANKLNCCLWKWIWDSYVKWTDIRLNVSNRHAEKKLCDPNESNEIIMDKKQCIDKWKEIQRKKNPIVLYVCACVYVWEKDEYENVSRFRLAKGQSWLCVTLNFEWKLTMKLTYTHAHICTSYKYIVACTIVIANEKFRSEKWNEMQFDYFIVAWPLYAHCIWCPIIRQNVLEQVISIAIVKCI